VVDETIARTAAIKFLDDKWREQETSRLRGSFNERRDQYGTRKEAGHVSTIELLTVIEVELCWTKKATQECIFIIRVR
jgi:hypothetical protein